MTFRVLTLTILLSLAFYAPDCQPNPDKPSNNSGKAENAGNQNGTSTQPAATVIGAVNPMFSVSEAQLRAAFADYVSRGEKKQKVAVGEERSTDVSVEGTHGSGSLKLRVLFLPPLEQAKARGYSFGLVAKQRTPEDRKAFEDVSIKRILLRTQQADFRVFLQQADNDDAAIPTITFKLVDKDGQRVNPTTQPTSYTAGRDIITAVALAEEGQELSFPLFSGARPYLTGEMDKMSLVVSVGGAEQTLEYRLGK
jgi:hypothetical protein